MSLTDNGTFNSVDHIFIVCGSIRTYRSSIPSLTVWLSSIVYSLCAIAYLPTELLFLNGFHTCSSLLKGLGQREREYLNNKNDNIYNSKAQMDKPTLTNIELLHIRYYKISLRSINKILVWTIELLRFLRNCIRSHHTEFEIINR